MARKGKQGGKGGAQGGPARRSAKQTHSERENDEIRTLQTRIASELVQPTSYPDVKKFHELPISKNTLQGLLAGSFTHMTEIQQKGIPAALAGRDVLGAARTGSGKTLVPALERLYRSKFDADMGLGALIISPTRELALQIFEVLRTIGRKHTMSAGLVIGGKNFREEQYGIVRMNLLVCTPGRLLQHLEQTADFQYMDLEVLILDEADRILDLGFKTQLDKILRYLPSTGERQTLLFSATQTKSVRDLARLSLNNPEYVAVHEKAEFATPKKLEQKYIVCPVGSKLDTLWSFLKTHLKCKTIVFLSTCRQVRFVHALFCKMQPGHPLAALHGNIKQLRRTYIYYDFLKKPAATLFCTDIAARGLDFPGIDWVVQTDCPEDTDMYIHRAGRTARYNKGGKAMLMLLPSEEEGMVEQLKEAKIPVDRIKVNPKKTQSIEVKVGAILAENQDIKLMAQKAFKSYLRSVLLMPNKKVFDVSQIPSEELATSFGLATAPRVKFLSQDQTREVVRTKKNVNKKLASLKESIRAESNAKKIAGAVDSSQASKKKSSAVNDDDDVEEEEELLVVKRQHTWSEGAEEEEEEDLSKYVTDPASRPRKRLKIKPDAIGTKSIKFDDDGVAKKPLTLLGEDGKLGLSSSELQAKSKDHQARIARMLNATDAEDRAAQKERIREKRLKKKLQARENNAEEDGEGGYQVVLGGASDSDSDSDSKGNDSMEEAEDSSREEEEEASDNDSDEDDSAGSAALSLEEQALKMMQQRRRGR